MHPFSLKKKKVVKKKNPYIWLNINNDFNESLLKIEKDYAFLFTKKEKTCKKKKKSMHLIKINNDFKESLLKKGKGLYIPFH